MRVVHFQLDGIPALVLYNSEGNVTFPDFVMFRGYSCFNGAVIPRIDVDVRVRRFHAQVRLS
jgi:hypothetical protein